MSAPMFYRMLDAPDANKAAIPVYSVADAAHWNTPERGFGIFTTVNSFDGPRRKEHLRRIRAWAVDMDDGTKEEQHRRILSAPLIPSRVVETKRGFQVWYDAQHGEARHWNAIVLERLVPYFGADKNARDLCRILRVPGFLHLKDPANSFRIESAWTLNVRYTERQLAAAFHWVPDMAAHRAQLREAQYAAEQEARELARQSAIALGNVPTETLWEAVAKLPGKDALERLSGSGYVNGEKFTFKPAARGRWNIFVDGKGTSCFIDEYGKIGSLSGGGPTPAQWLRWYGNDWPRVVEALKSAFPHLVDVDVEQRRARRS